MAIHTKGGASPWEIALREKIQLATKGSIRIVQSRGKVQLRANGKTATLDLLWDRMNDQEIYRQVVAIHERIAKGIPLGSAAKGVNCATDETGAPTFDHWQTYVDPFRNSVEMTAVGDTTWQDTYKPAIDHAIEIQTGEAPCMNSFDLMAQTLREKNWKPGTRRATTASNAINRYLQFIVEEKGVDAAFSRVSPTQLKKIRGIREEEAGNKSSTLEDHQILQVINSIEEAIPQMQSNHGDTAQRWLNAIKLMAVYGLRPEELRHLQTVTKGGGTYLWCRFEKKSRRGEATKPCRMEPCLLSDADGKQIDWHLLERLQADELPLPVMESAGSVSQNGNKFLNRKEVWCRLKEEKQAMGENLTAYTFRHSFSLRSHARGISTDVCAATMGHSTAKDACT